MISNVETASIQCMLINYLNHEFYKLDVISYREIEKMNIKKQDLIMTYSNEELADIVIKKDNELKNYKILEEQIGMSLNVLLTKVVDETIYFIDDQRINFEEVSNFTHYDCNGVYHDSLLIQTESCWWFEVCKFNVDWFLNEELAKKKLK